MYCLIPAYEAYDLSAFGGLVQNSDVNIQIYPLLSFRQACICNGSTLDGKMGDLKNGFGCPPWVSGWIMGGGQACFPPEVDQPPLA